MQLPLASIDAMKVWISFPLALADCGCGDPGGVISVPERRAGGVVAVPKRARRASSSTSIATTPLQHRIVPPAGPPSPFSFFCLCTTEPMYFKVFLNSDKWYILAAIEMRY